MNKQTYIDDLKSTARSIDQKLAAARKQLEGGEAAASADALKEVAWLETRHKDLTARLKQAESKHAEDWSEWHKGLREDFDGVIDSLERFIVKQTGA